MVDHKPSLHHLSFDVPCTYQIWVGGFIDPGLSARLEGMAVHPYEHNDGATLTLLHGELPDQAALVGVLNHLYQMHFVVLAVLQTGAEIDAADDP